MKRIVSLVLALSMVLSMFTTAFAGTALKDVEGTDYEAAVSALVELGIVAGYGDGTYLPEKVVTRAEMAKLLVVAAGLEDAADVSEGATNFTDVPASHWGSGYINVAAEYGYINGYPDGTFAPDATVTYSEAVTMAIRVLGYKSVVEAKGTWPTNYIAKATELKVLEDVDYDSYDDGAVRGNVAVLIWNMLTTRMWDVDSENETNGLNYSKQGTMINKYFEDYTYIDEEEEVRVVGITVDDGEVKVALESDDFYYDEDKDIATGYSNNVKLAEGTEFMNLFGRRVSVLYNEKEEEVVMIIPSNKDTVVVGYDYDLEDDKNDYTLATGDKAKVFGNENADYFYTVNVMSNKKKIADYTTYVGATENFIVKETKEVNDELKVTTIEDKTVRIKNEDAIVLIDGEWAARKDLEKDDVVTVLIKDELYVVNRETVEGSFDDVSSTGDVKKDFVKVEGKKYKNLLTDELVELDEDGDEIDDPKFADLDKDSKYFDEDCTLYVNFLNEVVRVEFAEVDGDADGKFYVVSNIPATWKDSGKDGEFVYIELNDETYEFKKNATILDATGAESNVDAIEEADVVFVKFSDGKIKELQVVDDGTEVDEYTFAEVNVEINDDGAYVDGETKYKVGNSTVVYTILEILDKDDVVEDYEVETSKGKSALEGIEEDILVAYKAEGALEGKYSVEYVFVRDDAKNTKVSFGKIDDDGYIPSEKEPKLFVDGTEYDIDVDENEYELSSSDEEKLVAFIDDEDGIVIKKVFEDDELTNTDYLMAFNQNDNCWFEVDGTAIDLDSTEDKKVYEDLVFVLVTYDVDAEEIDSVKVVSYEDVVAGKLDVDNAYVWLDEATDLEAIVIVELDGYVVENTEDDEENQQQPQQPATTFTVTWVVSGETVETDTDVQENAAPVFDGTEPAVDGYTFNGWSENSAATAADVVNLTTETITKNTTYHAIFTQN